ncbi:MAG: cytochrome-c peroxidase [Nitrospinales bacterium]
MKRRWIWKAGVLVISVIMLMAFTSFAFAGSQGSATPRPLAPLPPIPANGIPSPDAQKDNVTTATKVELGAMLFFDGRLSGDGSTPCAACHRPEYAWSQPDDLSFGYPGTLHFRAGQTVLNNVYLNKFFWDGRSLSLESQVGGAGFGQESNNVSAQMAEARLRQVPVYVKLFHEAFGEPPTWDNTARAVAAFERTLNSDPKNVPFDRYMNGDKTAMTAQQIKGMKLFEGKAGCINCHDGMLMTNQDYHNIGVPRNEAFDEDPLRQISIRYRSKAFGILNYDKVDEDKGLYFSTHRPDDIHKWRTAVLREIKWTAPYMHNGVFFTLEEVIDFYNEGGEEPVRAGVKDPLMKPLNLTDDEKAALVAFLEALSSDVMPGKNFKIPKIPPDGIMTAAGVLIPLPEKAGKKK